jgi:hypothetical protein
VATGCKNLGFVWAGVAFKLTVPPFRLPSSTFEDVLEKVAESPERWMWVVAPDQRDQGCIDNPLGMWQVGLYNIQPGVPLPFSASAGPSFVP